MRVINQIRLLQVDFPESSIVGKVLVTIPHRSESKVFFFFLEESRDLTTLTVEELVSSLQEQEQRRAIRQEEQPEGALLMNVNGKEKQA